MSNIDKLLKSALSPSQYPTKEINDRLMKQIKESGTMRIRKRNLMIAAALVLCLLILPASTYAVYRFLLPKEVALELEDTKLGESFEKDGKDVFETISDGKYQITYLGHVTGESLSERTGSAWELNPQRIYVAVAIEKIDGTEITYDDQLFVSPLIQGLKPWEFNIASMNGSYTAKIIDGALYRIIECDNVEVFADKELYLIISDTTFYSTAAFNYDEATGLISINETYQGTNVLFDLDLDASKADPAKADEYIKQLEAEWNN